MASKLEWRVKHLTKQQKEALCETPERLSEFVAVEEAGQAEIVLEFTSGKWKREHCNQTE